MVFGIRKKEETTVEATANSECVPNKMATVIGHGTYINGTISVEGTLRVDGQIEGELRSTGDVIVGETGHVIANIAAKNVTVAGKVQGNIDASEQLDILSGGKVFGDISVANLIVGQGGILQGKCEMKDSAIDEIENW